jgi:hypothetical protein
MDIHININSLVRRVFFEKFMDTQQVRKFPAFIDL